jgi:Zn-finger nucleic acid-binding protein
MLLAHPDLIQILETSWRAVSEKQAEEIPFCAPEGWKEELVLRCPDCHHAMDKYGYMGLVAILIDRCDRCILVWLDTDELQNMVLALARTNYRTQRALRDGSRNELDFAFAAMPGLAMGTRPRNWLFSNNVPEGTAVAASLLRLFMR